MSRIIQIIWFGIYTLIGIVIYIMEISTTALLLSKWIGLSGIVNYVISFFVTGIHIGITMWFYPWFDAWVTGYGVDPAALLIWGIYILWSGLGLLGLRVLRG